MADANDPRPIYIQISEELKSMILSGELAEGQRAPSTKELSDFYQVNPTTSAKAMTQLSTEGLVDKKRGLGMFVSPGAREQIRASRKESFAHDFIAPLKREAEALGIGIEELVELLKKEA